MALPLQDEASSLPAHIVTSRFESKVVIEATEAGWNQGWRQENRDKIDSMAGY